MQMGQMLALRFTAVYFEHLFRQPKSFHLMLEIERLGAFVVPVDHVTDCFDFLELVTGLRGVPADKSQRLAILSAREERMTGRIRHFFHFPTDIMLADELTKSGIYPQLLRFLTTGLLSLHSAKPVTVRTLRASLSYTEDDLMHLEG